MNISAKQSEPIQERPTDSSSSGVDKTTPVQKPDEKKEEAPPSDFKKLLEEPKDTDKLSLEQLAAQSNLLPVAQNEDYAQKFGFDTVSSLKNMQSMFNYDTAKISKDDAKFFSDLVENKQFAVQQNGDKTNLIKFADEVGPTYKTQNSSKVLTDLINKAYNDQKPVRIDFDNNVSVILRIDGKGKVSAEFIPGDKAVEAYLRNNIGYLKQRFDDQNLPYNDLMYRQSNRDNQNREKQNQQKEKGE